MDSAHPQATIPGLSLWAYASFLLTWPRPLDQDYHGSARSNQTEFSSTTWPSQLNERTWGSATHPMSHTSPCTPNALLLMTTSVMLSKAYISFGGITFSLVQCLIGAYTTKSVHLFSSHQCVPFLTTHGLTPDNTLMAAQQECNPLQLRRKSVAAFWHRIKVSLCPTTAFQNEILACV